MDSVFGRALLLALLFWQVSLHPVASPEHLRYQRVFKVSSSAGSRQACAVLDPEVFAHASASLKDMRLFRKVNGEETEIPYATTLSEPAVQDTQPARILNLGLRQARIVFDLEMPHRAFTGVVLDLAAKDFIATAVVSGASSSGAVRPTRLSVSTLFDLSSQHLSRSTSINLPETSFAYLHVELSISAAPGSGARVKPLLDPAILKGASVPPSREAQTIYTTLQQTAMVTQRGRQTVATLEVPMRVPVERVSFTLNSSFKGNFSRAVEIKAHADTAAGDPAADDSVPREEALSGSIDRVRTTEAAQEISLVNLSVPAAIGSNMQRPATIEVAVDNGDDPPLPITAVRLEMRQRRICFDAPAVQGPLTLYYGDPALEAPVYDYAKLFQPVVTPLAAELGTEGLNTGFTLRPETKAFTERHPELLWLGLLAMICLLAVTAFRAAKRLPR